MSTNWYAIVQMPLIHTTLSQFNVLMQHDFARKLAYNRPESGMQAHPETTARPSLEGFHAHSLAGASPIQ
jgi:hypothetical protein